MYFLRGRGLCSEGGPYSDPGSAEAVYWATLSPCQLNSHPDLRGAYIIDAAQDQSLGQTAEQLHACFMDAVEYVLEDQARLKPFCIPDALLPSLYESWKATENLGLTGRFDFSFHRHGIKLYEYNADSPACIFETARLQSGQLADMAIPGVSAGRHLSALLIEAWRAMDSGPLVHILRDNVVEEEYHSLFMQELIEASGKRCKILVGSSGICLGDGGFLVDGDGERLQFVWKTWSWSSVLEAIQSRPSGPSSGNGSGDSPDLADILLHSSVQVVEPLWKWIPSCKAILPVLWDLFPDNPFLLPCSYSLDPHLLTKGYASKPVNGRCGLNVELCPPGSGGRGSEASTHIHPSGPPRVYQELCYLPWIDRAYVQVHAFTVRGRYAGAGLRLSADPIIQRDDRVAPLCIAEPSHLNGLLDGSRHA